MTHLYRMLVGGNVLPGGEEPTVSAVAWAEDMLIALGTDEDVLSISRGDSLVWELRGAWVVPLADMTGRGSGSRTLEVGRPADLAVVDRDPRPLVVAPRPWGIAPPDGEAVAPRPRGFAPADGEAVAGAARVIAVIRGGRVVAGDLGGSVSVAQAQSDRRPREGTATAG